MRVAIVDDVPSDAKRLEAYLRRYQEETGTEFQPEVYPSAERFLAEYAGRVELIIMDIDMPGINGVEAAQRLRAQGDEVALMFVTNMPQYALQGYSVDAIDYVLKPVAYTDFAMKLRKAERYIRRMQTVSLLLQTTEGRSVAVDSSEVFYVESSLHYCIYHTAQGDFRVRSSMTQAEAGLPASQFARCNTCYLVNLQKVREIGRDDVLVGTARLKISRGKRLEFLQRFTKYVGGMGT